MDLLILFAKQAFVAVTFTDSIRNEILSRDWKSLFHKLNVNDTSVVFTYTSVQIISRHFPNKIITCNDKDAPWITPQIKRLLNVILGFIESGLSVVEKCKSIIIRHSNLTRRTKNFSYLNDRKFCNSPD